MWRRPNDPQVRQNEFDRNNGYDRFNPNPPFAPLLHDEKPACAISNQP
jgi:hypothetical protein